jgi:hypothetical protein
MIKMVKGYFPFSSKIDIHTRTCEAQNFNQNLTLISNLRTFFYLVAYFLINIIFSEPCQINDFYENSNNFPLIIKTDQRLVNIVKIYRNDLE